MKENYDDIINLEHHVSKVHERMSLENRSAQFAPFSALTGYDETVKETERFTEERIELNEEQKNILDEKICQIQAKIKEAPIVTITYFVQDTLKQGGTYQNITGSVKKIDDYNKTIILDNGSIVPIKDIIDILDEEYKVLII